MKLYCVLLLLFIAKAIYPMIEEKKGQSVTSVVEQEWNAQEYAKGNRVQEIMALKFLGESEISLEGKDVLDIGCGTGNITAHIANQAQSAYGVDVSHSMIEYARQQYQTKTNLAFEQCKAECFEAKNLYDVAVTFSCLHWIEDKNMVIENVGRALKRNGDFFGVYQSSLDPEPIHFAVFKEVIKELSVKYPVLNDINFTEASSFFLISHEELNSLLLQNGFSIVSHLQKSIDLTLTKENIIESMKPIIMSFPIMQQQDKDDREYIFGCFLGTLLQKLHQTEDNRYYIPQAVCSSVFHAKKIVD